MEIVLVEDGDADAQMVERALRKGGFSQSVVRLRDGEEALALLLSDPLEAAGRQHPRRLVLLDVNLPGVSGIEVLRRLRNDARTAELPIVMLTGSTDEADRLESDALGVNMYLVKPVDATVIAHMVSYARSYWEMKP